MIPERSMEKKINVIFSVWRQFYTLIRVYPAILLPFALMLLLDLALLFLVLFLQYSPASTLFSPVISKIWGEEFIHYPANLLLLPKIFDITNSIMKSFIGVIFIAMSVFFMASAARKIEPVFSRGLRKAYKRYSRLAIVSLFMVMAGYLGAGLAGSVRPLSSDSNMQFVAINLFNVILQVMFLFMIPVIIIENRKIPAAVRRSFLLIKQYPVISVLLVGIPWAAIILVSLLYLPMPSLMIKFFPEMIIYTLLFKIIVINAVDFMVIPSAGLLLIKHKNEEEIQ